MPAPRPMLFLDVDGPLIPFGTTHHPTFAPTTDPHPPSALDAGNGLHWKTLALVEWAGGRPFAWVDDESADTDRAWVAAHHPGPALLHRVDPRHGLRDADYATLGAWLRDSGS
ncbi:hypothetical protein [Umezawaea sp. NPDC059074]|uniref:hypothetical protein n=1 Tax=Umezawaea sp. NPDC059074 TaxID=3346716 RepID=UPI00367CA154